MCLLNSELWARCARTLVHLTAENEVLVTVGLKIHLPLASEYLQLVLSAEESAQAERKLKEYVPWIHVNLRLPLRLSITINLCKRSVVIAWRRP